MEYTEWLLIRNNSVDEYNDKLCYCGHTYKCSCPNPGEQLFKESVERGVLNPDDVNNGWKNINDEYKNI